MTTKENLKALIENMIYSRCSTVKGSAVDAYHATANLRITGLSKLNVKELRQLKDVFEMD